MKILYISIVAIFFALAACQQNTVKTDVKSEASGGNITRSKEVISGKDGFVLVEVSPANAGTDIQVAMKAEADKAKEKNLKPFILFHASWCGPCKLLVKNMDQPAMKDALKGKYIVELDTDEWSDQIQKIKYPVNSIPAFCPLEASGVLNTAITDASEWDVNNPETAAPILKAYFNAH